MPFRAYCETINPSQRSIQLEGQARNSQWCSWLGRDGWQGRGPAGSKPPSQPCLCAIPLGCGGKACPSIPNPAARLAPFERRRQTIIQLFGLAPFVDCAGSGSLRHFVRSRLEDSGNRQRQRRLAPAPGASLDFHGIGIS